MTRINHGSRPWLKRSEVRVAPLQRLRGRHLVHLRFDNINGPASPVGNWQRHKKQEAAISGGLLFF